MTNRQARLKNLMRDRNTVDQGLTLYQVFCEVYPDIVEEYTPGKRDEYGVETVEYVFRNKYYDSYTRRLIKQLRKTDDDFRWLSLVPCKNEKGKIKEYRYVNIKTKNSYGEELLTEVNAFWSKHSKGTQKGFEDAMKRIEFLSQIPAEEIKRSIKHLSVETEYENRIFGIIGKGIHYRNYSYPPSNKNIDNIIDELKSENIDPSLYNGAEPNYKAIRRIVKSELLNPHVIGTMTSVPSVSEIRKTIKEIIITYDKKTFRKYRKQS